MLSQSILLLVLSDDRFMSYLQRQDQEIGKDIQAMIDILTTYI
jgi:hypothetical protein